MAVSDNTKTKSKENNGKSSKLLYNVIAIIFWLYLVINNAVFNFETYAIEKFFPEISWINQWPLLKLAVLSLAILLILKLVFYRKARWVLFVIFYPIVLIFWKIPYFLIRNKHWFAVSALFHLIISFLSSFKINIVIASLYIILFFGMCICTNNVMVYIFSALMTAMIFAISIRAIYNSLRPSTLITAYKKANLSFLKIINDRTQFERKPDENNEELSDDQLLKWVNKLQYRVLCNRVLLFASKKLQDYTREIYDFLRLIISVALLIILIVISFTICNLRLYRVVPDSFYYNGSHSPSWFLFLYYSIQNLFHNTISDLSPVSTFARCLQISEYITGFLIITLLIGTLLSVIIKKRQQETNEIIQTLEQDSKELELSVVSDLKVENIEAAIQELKNAKASLYSAIIYLSNLI